MRSLLAAVVLASALPGFFGARAPAHDAAADGARVKACEKARKEIMAEPACADEGRSAEQIRCEKTYVAIWPLAKACDDKTGKSIIPKTKPLKGSSGGASAASSSSAASRPPKAKTHSTYVETTPTPTP